MVAGTVRIPALPQHAIAAVSAHLQTHHDAQPAGMWRIQFRPYHSTLAPSTGPRHRRMMWEVTDAAYPHHVFVVFEDTSHPTRAEVHGTRTEGVPLRRWHAHVLSAEFHTMLRQSTLPGPLGSPAGTLGPAAWAQRGAQTLLDGVSFRVRLGSSSPARQDASKTAGEQEECILSIGHVIVGAGRVAGGMVEIQYLPLSHLPPDSTLLGSLLASLLPPDIVPLLVPISTMNPMALPTMIPPIQLAEIVPASGSAKAVPVPGAPGFGPWDDDDDGQHAETTLDPIGWTGIEMRRRMAYVHLIVLRTEGLA